MAAPRPMQDDNAQLTKPADWSTYMVNAAIRAVKDDKLPLKYSSYDEGKTETLRALNFYEAHGEYTWPKFATLGFDFAQAMKLRRALVNDVFNALVKTQDVVVRAAGGLGITDSNKKRMHVGVIGQNKRVCQRHQRDAANNVATPTSSNADSDIYDADRCYWHDDKYLADTMRELIVRCAIDIDDEGGWKDVTEMADLVQDTIVEEWNDSVQDSDSSQEI